MCSRMHFSPISALVCRQSESIKYYQKRMPKLNSQRKAFFKDYSSLIIISSSNIQGEKNQKHFSWYLSSMNAQIKEAQK